MTHCSLASTASARLQLPKLGLGAAPLGNLYRSVTDQEAQETLQAAFAQGFDYLDTAPHYGFGLSESRLGLTLRLTQASPKISTKVGRILVPTDSTESVRFGFVDTPALTPQFDYTYDGIMRSFSESQRRLQREKIDLLLVHDLGQMTHGKDHPKHLKDFLDGGYRAMRELHSAGLVSALGAGVNEWQIAQELIEEIDLDFVLLAGRYTLLEQEAARAFFPLCLQKNVGIILGGVFNSGILATGTQNQVGANQSQSTLYYNYEPAPQHIIARVKKIEGVCRHYSVSLASAAAQFALAHPQVTSVIFGLASVSQVQQLRLWLDEKIPAEFWMNLRSEKLIDADLPLPNHD